MSEGGDAKAPNVCDQIHRDDHRPLKTVHINSRQFRVGIFFLGMTLVPVFSVGVMYVHPGRVGQIRGLAANVENPEPVAALNVHDGLS